MERQNIFLYGVADAPNRRPEAPVRVVFLTSIRDVGVCDLNGLVVETRSGRRYMEGSLERFVREIRPGGRLNGLAELGGVITDDLPRDLAGSDYPLTQTLGRPWIHPENMTTADGSLIRDLTVNIGSDFRALPLTDVEARQRRKLIFEGRVLEEMRRREASVLISDHYMAQIDHLYRWLPGHVLNIHPAVTKNGHPFRFVGKTPTADTLNYAGEHEYTRTGATLHFVGPKIDEGPIIAFTADTPVYHDDQPQWLRHRNYEMAKNPVLVEGLVHYITNIHRHLSYLDRTRMQPVARS